MPPEARIGRWMFEWYWNQPDVPHVEQFVAEIRKRATARCRRRAHWFGYASVQTFALVANQEKTLDGVKLAKALGDFKLPPEVALQPNKCYYRAGDHQLMSDVLRRRGVASRRAIPTTCSKSITWSPARRSPPESETGCKFKWPA